MISVLLLCEAMILMRQTNFLKTNIQMAAKPENEITEAQIEEIRKAELKKEAGADITAWLEKRQERIFDANGLRSAVTDVILLNGSSELLFSNGKILHREDREGCLIGEKTAELLFGSRDAAGLTLCYGGSELTVRGVLSMPQELLVVEAAGEESFNRITVFYRKGISRKAEAEKFCATYGIAADVLRWDCFSWDWIAEMIPGKWSDFSGWKQSIQGKQKEWTLLLTLEKSSMEEVYLKENGIAVLSFAAGSVLLVLGCIGTSRKQESPQALAKI